MTPILKIEGLTHRYSVGTPFAHTAIDNINLEIPQGQFVGLIGHTGSGKSTFIQHLNGLLRPSAGTVYYEGKDIFASKTATRDVRFKVGLVFQYPEYQLFEETVYQDIAFGPKNQKLKPKEVDERVREAAKFVGIGEELFDKSPLELSGGQKRRVAIAGVIAMRPDCIVLDEATAMLDPVGRSEVIKTVTRLCREQGITVVHITHHMEECVDADRLIVMDDGVIVADGSPKQVFAQVDMLRSHGLTVPATTDLIHRMNMGGCGLNMEALSVDDCVEEIAKLFQ